MTTATANHPSNTQAPESIHIKPRRMEFAMASAPRRYWYDNDPFLTHFFNALSACFPEGERFFMISVRHYLNDINDPKLKADVRAFIGQEAHHGKQHEQYNALMSQQSVDVKKYERKVGQVMKFVHKHFSPQRQLAITCALEHFTAILADQLLTRPDVTERMAQPYRELWRWHAVEETEHKGVCFDVYRYIGGSERVRRSAMRRVTLLFWSRVARYHLEMMMADGQLFNLKSWARGFKTLFWGKQGWVSGMLPKYLDYYRKDFHPWQHDNSALVAAWINEQAIKA